MKVIDHERLPIYARISHSHQYVAAIRQVLANARFTILTAKADEDIWILCSPLVR